jgi:hypothetical protein
MSFLKLKKSLYKMVSVSFTGFNGSNYSPDSFGQLFISNMPTNEKKIYYINFYYPNDMCSQKSIFYNSLNQITVESGYVNFYTGGEGLQVFNIVVYDADDILTPLNQPINVNAGGPSDPIVYPSFQPFVQPLDDTPIPSSTVNCNQNNSPAPENPSDDRTLLYYGNSQNVYNFFMNSHPMGMTVKRFMFN